MLLVRLFVVATCTFAAVSPVRSGKLDELRISCNSGELGTLKQAVANASKLAKNASLSLPPVNSTGGARFMRWFGGPAGEYDAVVKRVYDEMSITLVFQKFWCLPPNSSTPDEFFHTNAFIIRGSVGEIFVTSNFFQLPATGIGSQGGTIVHEASHQSSIRKITDDDKHYGPVAAQGRAASSASRARSTADNYKYYAEDVVYGIP